MKQIWCQICPQKFNLIWKHKSQPIHSPDQTLLPTFIPHESCSKTLMETNWNNMQLVEKTRRSFAGGTVVEKGFQIHSSRDGMSQITLGI